MRNLLVVIIVSLFVLKIDVFPFFIPNFWLVPFGILCRLTSKLLLNLDKRTLKFLVIESKFLILSLFLVSIFYLLEYGNFRLESLFITMFSSVPFYVVGFLWGRQKDFNSFYRVVNWLFILNITYIFVALVVNFNYFPYSREELAMLFYSERNSSNLIFYLPFIALLTTLVYVSNKTLSPLMGLVLVFSLFFIVISTFASPLFFVLVSYFFYRLMRTKKSRGEYALNLVFLFGGIYLLLTIVDSGLFGNLGATSSKISALLFFINSGFNLNVEILENITSQRWTSMIYSVIQFVNSPWIGHGAYLEGVGEMLGDVSSFTTASGGHNFFIDILAFFGVLGLPIILITLKTVRDAYHLVKEYPEKIYVSYFAIVVSIFASNILNSWILFNYLDHLTMILYGFILGLKFYQKGI